MERQQRRGRVCTVARPKTTAEAAAPAVGRPTALLDMRVIYCGDCLDPPRFGDKVVAVVKWGDGTVIDRAREVEIKGPSSGGGGD